MDTYRRLEDLPVIAESVLTIGTFDGLHKGHQAVIQRLVTHASEQGLPAVVITFDPHPQHVLAPPGTPKKELIITLDKKLSLLDRQSVDLVLVLPFDRALSQVTAHNFLHDIVMQQFHPTRLVIGYDHHFGHDRQGDAEFLQRQAAEFHYAVEVVEGVRSSGLTVNSSNIRRLLQEGRCELAEDLLGWPYEISGRIVPGDDRGQALGYPTANLMPDEGAQLIPRQGVYVVSSDIDGKTAYGMCNVGVRPTFDGRSLTIETHYFDPPEANLYDRHLAVRFHHWLRKEHKFQDAEELRKQLDQDKQTALDWITEYHGGQKIHALVS